MIRTMSRKTSDTTEDFNARKSHRKFNFGLNRQIDNPLMNYQSLAGQLNSYGYPSIDPNLITGGILSDNNILPPGPAPTSIEELIEMATTLVLPSEKLDSNYLNQFAQNSLLGDIAPLPNAPFEANPLGELFQDPKYRNEFLINLSQSPMMGHLLPMSYNSYGYPFGAKRNPVDDDETDNDDKGENVSEEFDDKNDKERRHFRLLPEETQKRRLIQPIPKHILDRINVFDTNNNHFEENLIFPRSKRSINNLDVLFDQLESRRLLSNESFADMIDVNLRKMVKDNSGNFEQEEGQLEKLLNTRKNFLVSPIVSAKVAEAAGVKAQKKIEKPDINIRTLSTRKPYIKGREILDLLNRRKMFLGTEEQEHNKKKRRLMDQIDMLEAIARDRAVEKVSEMDIEEQIELMELRKMLQPLEQYNHKYRKSVTPVSGNVDLLQFGHRSSKKDRKINEDDILELLGSKKNGEEIREAVQDKTDTLKDLFSRRNNDILKKRKRRMDIAKLLTNLNTDSGKTNINHLLKGGRNDVPDLFVASRKRLLNNPFTKHTSTKRKSSSKNSSKRKMGKKKEYFSKRNRLAKNGNRRINIRFERGKDRKIDADDILDLVGSKKDAEEIGDEIEDKKDTIKDLFSKRERVIENFQRSSKLKKERKIDADDALELVGSEKNVEEIGDEIEDKKDIIKKLFSKRSNNGKRTMDISKLLDRLNSDPGKKNINHLLKGGRENVPKLYETVSRKMFINVLNQEPRMDITRRRNVGSALEKSNNLLDLVHNRKILQHEMDYDSFDDLRRETDYTKQHDIYDDGEEVDIQENNTPLNYSFYLPNWSDFRKSINLKPNHINMDFLKETLNNIPIRRKIQKYNQRLPIRKLEQDDLMTLLKDGNMIIPHVEINDDFMDKSITVTEQTMFEHLGPEPYNEESLEATAVGRSLTENNLSEKYKRDTSNKTIDNAEIHRRSFSKVNEKKNSVQSVKNRSSDNTKSVTIRRKRNIYQRQFINNQSPIRRRLSTNTDKLIRLIKNLQSSSKLTTIKRIEPKKQISKSRRNLINMLPKRKFSYKNHGELYPKRRLSAKDLRDIDDENKLKHPNQELKYEKDQKLSDSDTDVLIKSSKTIQLPSEKRMMQNKNPYDNTRMIKNEIFSILKNDLNRDLEGSNNNQKRTGLPRMITRNVLGSWNGNTFKNGDKDLKSFTGGGILNQYIPKRRFEFNNSPKYSKNLAPKKMSTYRNEQNAKDKSVEVMGGDHLSQLLEHNEFLQRYSPTRRLDVEAINALLKSYDEDNDSEDSHTDLVRSMNIIEQDLKKYATNYNDDMPQRRILHHYFDKNYNSIEDLDVPYYSQSRRMSYRDLAALLNDLKSLDKESSTLKKPASDLDLPRSANEFETKLRRLYTNDFETTMKLFNGRRLDSEAINDLLQALNLTQGELKSKTETLKKELRELENGESNHIRHGVKNKRSRRTPEKISELMEKTHMSEDQIKCVLNEKLNSDDDKGLGKTIAGLFDKDKETNVKDISKDTVGEVVDWLQSNKNRRIADDVLSDVVQGINNSYNRKTLKTSLRKILKIALLADDDSTTRRMPKKELLEILQYTIEPENPYRRTELENLLDEIPTECFKDNNGDDKDHANWATKTAIKGFLNHQKGNKDGLKDTSKDVVGHIFDLFRTKHKDRKKREISIKSLENHVQFTRDINQSMSTSKPTNGIVRRTIGKKRNKSNWNTRSRRYDQSFFGSGKSDLLSIKEPRKDLKHVKKFQKQKQYRKMSNDNVNKENFKKLQDPYYIPQYSLDLKTPRNDSKIIKKKLKSYFEGQSKNDSKTRIRRNVKKTDSSSKKVRKDIKHVKKLKNIYSKTSNVNKENYKKLRRDPYYVPQYSLDLKKPQNGSKIIKNKRKSNYVGGQNKNESALSRLRRNVNYAEHTLTTLLVQNSNKMQRKHSQQYNHKFHHPHQIKHTTKSSENSAITTAKTNHVQFLTMNTSTETYKIATLNEIDPKLKLYPTKSSFDTEHDQPMRRVFDNAIRKLIENSSLKSQTTLQKFKSTSNKEIKISQGKPQRKKRDILNEALKQIRLTQNLNNDENSTLQKAWSNLVPVILQEGKSNNEYNAGRRFYNSEELKTLQNLFGDLTTIPLRRFSIETLPTLENGPSPFDFSGGDNHKVTKKDFPLRRKKRETLEQLMAAIKETENNDNWRTEKSKNEENDDAWDMDTMRRLGTVLKLVDSADNESELIDSQKRYDMTRKIAQEIMPLRRLPLSSLRLLLDKFSNLEKSNEQDSRLVSSRKINDEVIPSRRLPYVTLQKLLEQLNSESTNDEKGANRFRDMVPVKRINVEEINNAGKNKEPVFLYGNGTVGLGMLVPENRMMDISPSFERIEANAVVGRKLDSQGISVESRNMDRNLPTRESQGNSRDLNSSIINSNDQEQKDNQNQANNEPRWDMLPFRRLPQKTLQKVLKESANSSANNRMSHDSPEIQNFSTEPFDIESIQIKNDAIDIPVDPNIALNFRLNQSPNSKSGVLKEIPTAYDKPLTILLNDLNKTPIRRIPRDIPSTQKLYLPDLKSPSTDRHSSQKKPKSSTSTNKRHNNPKPRITRQVSDLQQKKPSMEMPIDASEGRKSATVLLGSESTKLQLSKASRNFFKNIIFRPVFQGTRAPKLKSPFLGALLRSSLSEAKQVSEKIEDGLGTQEVRSKRETLDRLLGTIKAWEKSKAEEMQNMNILSVPTSITGRPPPNIIQEVEPPLVPTITSVPDPISKLNAPLQEEGGIKRYMDGDDYENSQKIFNLQPASDFQENIDPSAPTPNVINRKFNQEIGQILAEYGSLSGGIRRFLDDTAYEKIKGILNTNLSSVSPQNAADIRMQIKKSETPGSESIEHSIKRWLDNIMQESNAEKAESLQSILKKTFDVNSANRKFVDTTLFPIRRGKVDSKEIIGNKRNLSPINDNIFSEPLKKILMEIFKSRNEEQKRILVDGDSEGLKNDKLLNGSFEFVDNIKR